MGRDGHFKGISLLTTRFVKQKEEIKLKLKISGFGSTGASLIFISTSENELAVSDDYWDLI